MSEETAPPEQIKIDTILSDLGFTSTLDGPPGIGVDLVERLVPHMVDFIEGGGHFSWAEWARLSNQSRQAAVLAGRRVNESLAANIAAALSDGDYATALATGEPVEKVTNQREAEAAIDAVIAEQNG